MQTDSKVQSDRPYYQSQRAKWINNGLMISFSPNACYLPVYGRRGGQLIPTEQHKLFINEHTESKVLSYKKSGVEVIHYAGWVGYGFEARRWDMEKLKDTVKFVYKHGMKLCLYCQTMSIVPETLFALEPRAKEWVQRDELGRPILLDYDYMQSYRQRPNPAHPEFRMYYKEKVIKTLMDEYRPDMLHFDNFECNREPESDHSLVTVEAFQDYLRRKYTSEQQFERFGHTNIDLINPPLWNLANNPREIKEIRDPVQQEWIDFRCWLMADFLRDVSEYARSINPEVVIETNPQGLGGYNRAFQTAIWHPWIMKYSEVLWTEEGNNANYNERGVIISKIRTFKMGRTLDNIILAYMGDDRSWAENLAFNQTPGLTPPPKYYDFYQTYRHFYTGTRNREDVALLRSYHSMAYDNHRAELEQCMFEQAMIQAHVPFDIIFDEQMDDLSRYKILVLVGQNNLSAEHIKNIEKFVEQGGNLVFTGETAHFDQWHRRRPHPGLEHLLNESKKSDTGGRVVYVSEIVSPDRDLAQNWRGSVGSEGSWMLPANWVELVWSIRQAAGGRFSVEVVAPDWVAIEQVEKENFIMIHLVNYRKDNPLYNVPIDIQFSAGKSVYDVQVISPDREESQHLRYSLEKDRCHFIVPVLEVYDVIIVSLADN